jgi:hypothetical protein
MINFYHHRNMVIIHFGQNHVILVVKVQWSETIDV